MKEVWSFESDDLHRRTVDYSGEFELIFFISPEMNITMGFIHLHKKSC